MAIIEEEPEYHEVELTPVNDNFYNVRDLPCIGGDRDFNLYSIVEEDEEPIYEQIPSTVQRGISDTSYISQTNIIESGSKSFVIFK